VVAGRPIGVKSAQKVTKIKFMFNVQNQLPSTPHRFYNPYQAQVWDLSSSTTPFPPPAAKSNQNLHFAFLQWLSSLVACLVLALYIETIWNSLYIDLKTQISTYAYHTPQTAQILHRKSKKIQNRNLLKLIFKKVLFTFIRIWKFLY